mgnify:CR=1 FL=1
MLLLHPSSLKADDMIKAILAATAAISVLGLTAAAAQQSPPADSTVIDVTLADFSFTPSSLQFQHGQHYQLQLHNKGSGGHNFAGKDFFAAVTVDAADQNLIRKGAVEVKKGATAAIGFTAVKPGTYRIKCTHFLHSGFGMKGSAVIN